jgi:hypothetical protein
VEPEFVPLFILRVPVFYYMRPPRHFHGWHAHKPPRWGEHWGHEWERRRSGWDRWDSRSVPPPAPLPAYQRQYFGKKYPGLDQQQELRNRHYHYQPRDTAIREHLQPRIERKAFGPAPPGKSKESRGKDQQEPASRFSRPLEQRSPGDPVSPRPGGEIRPPKAPLSPQKGMQREPPKRSQRQWDPRYSRPHKQSGSAGPGLPPRRGVENRQRQFPTQAPPPQRGPGLQDQRRPSGDGHRGREQSGSRDR